MAIYLIDTFGPEISWAGGFLDLSLVDFELFPPFLREERERERTRGRRGERGRGREGGREGGREYMQIYMYVHVQAH